MLSVVEDHLSVSPLWLPLLFLPICGSELVPLFAVGVFDKPSLNGCFELLFLFLPRRFSSSAIIFLARLFYRIIAELIYLFCPLATRRHPEKLKDYFGVAGKLLLKYKLHLKIFYLFL